MPEFQINYLAAGGAALATIIIGALWYSPLLFGNLWLEAHGYSSEHMRNVAGRNLVVSLICYGVMAIVFAVIVSYAGVSTALQGAILGVMLWFGFLATMGLTAHLVSDNPLSIYLIDAGYQLVYAVVMGVILTLWQ